MRSGGMSPTQVMKRWSAGEHFRYERRPDATPARDELDLSPGVSLVLPCPASPLLEQMARDFSSFLGTCMAVRVVRRVRGQGNVVFTLDSRCGGGGVAPAEAFVVEASARRLVISAPSERGLLHACHYLERRMAVRGGPFIPKGRTERTRLLDPYISFPLFHDGPNFSLMSHFGVNGILFTIRLWDYCRNAALPELNTPDYEQKIRALRRRCREAAVYGIDVYLDINHWGGFPADAPVFREHPTVRGAEFYYSINGSAFALCSSAPTVLRCYSEAFENLFRDAPELGGVSLIVGGEGLMHCFTRPKPSLRGRTNCPHCIGRNPSRDVARLVNGIARAVHRAKPGARVFAWPYSASRWSGPEDRAQTELIRHLDRRVLFLSNFDTPCRVRLGRASVSLIDYNIRTLGPSEQYAEQSRALARRGMAHYAKTESAISVFFTMLPYLPVHYRWFERYRRIRAQGAPGILAKWHFYGLTGSLPEELLCETVWEQAPRVDRILANAARRDFGRVDVARLLRGWQRLSRAWDRIPLSHVLFGERNGYFKGPFWLGPAHPLIFDAQRDYGLSRKFVTRDPGRPFPHTPPASEAISRASVPNTPHKYVSDQFFVFPFTPEAVESALGTAIRDWDAGVRLIEHAVGPKPYPRAVMELDVCRALGAILRTARHVVRFYRIRDALFIGRGSRAVLHRRVRELSRILDAELANAEAMLPILERDPRIGYGTHYGRPFDAAMVREKISQCRYVRDIELPERTRRLLEYLN